MNSPRLDKLYKHIIYSILSIKITKRNFLSEKSHFFQK